MRTLPPWRRLDSNSGTLLLGRTSCSFLVLATETLDATGGIHQLLLPSEERVAVGANFHADIALVSRTGVKRVPAGAMHAHFVVGGMNSGLHDFRTPLESFILQHLSRWRQLCLGEEPRYLGILGTVGILRYAQ